MKERNKYLSRRELPLLWSADGPPSVPCITAEYYIKWYELYVVHPTGEVTQLHYNELEPFAGSESAYCDHVPNPDVVERYAADYGYDIDDLCWEVLLGRYQEAVGVPATRYLLVGQKRDEPINVLASENSREKATEVAMQLSADCPGGILTIDLVSRCHKHTKHVAAKG